MATVEARITKTLAEGLGSLPSEPARSQTPMGAGSSGSSGRAGSRSAPDEIGARVSASNNEGLNGDISCRGGVAVTRHVVETSFGGPNRAVPCGGKETIKGLDSVLGVEKNEENGAEKIATESKTVLVGDGSDRKVGFNGNGISLVVEVRVDEGEKKRGYGDDRGCMFENGGVPVEKFTETRGTMSKLGNIKKGGKQVVNGNGEERGDVEDVGNDNEEEDEGDDGEDVGEYTGEEDEDDDGEDVGDQEHEYSVGDFVWGKIRSHPWWPGQIYDSSDASEYAAKYNQKDRLLVAYFGDGSFSWCFPSQLKPFAENFEEMSKQSNSKSFVNAIQKALDAIGRLVELEMTCSCIPEESRIVLLRPLAVNGGIKAGVLVPQGDIGKLSIPRHEPAELLANVRYVAQVVSITCMLELTVLKSWLSAFYRAKGGYPLPLYHEPQLIEGLEDKNKNGVMGTADFNGPVEVPIQGPSEEDWLSSPVSPGFGQTGQSLLLKCPAISRDKLYQRRKQKSVAELMGEDMDVEPKNKKGSMVKERSRPGMSTSGKKKRKGNDEAEIHDDRILISPSGSKRGRKKKADICGSPTTTENKVSSVENGGGGGEDEVNESPLLRKWKRNKVSSVGNDDEAKEETEKTYASRERRKSKYLSPPYTNPKWRVRNSSFKKDSETESEKISKIAQMGERMTRAAGQLIGSPPILKCSGETFQKKHSEELGSSGRDRSGSSNPQTAKKDQQKIIDSMEINATTNEVLTEVQCAALNPLYLREKISLDMITRFISTFRSSIYLNGSNYKMYHNRRLGRKRKSLNSEPVPLGKDLSQTVHKSPEPRSQQTGNEKKEEAKLNIPKRKRAARASGMKTKDNEAERKASPVALIVTFPPGVSLPSKGDLIKIFSKFGTLNETETDVLYNSYCARVAFVRSSDAEEAFSISVKKSPFEAANVNYRLWYSSAASRATKELDQKASSPLKETLDNAVASQPSDDEVSRLRFIREKLKMITSMLENSDGKISLKMKSKLEGEMKSLLEKVSTMAESTSS